MSDKRDSLTGLIMIAIFAVLFLNSVMIEKPVISDNSDIAELQNEALDLQIYEKVSYLRWNAKELFGFSRYSSKKFIENEVTFYGYERGYIIEYGDLIVEWDEYDYIRISYEGSKVCFIRFELEFWGGYHVVEVQAYHRGEWTNVFNEMFLQAIKGIPVEEEDLLLKNWGITK
ncbi:MAG: hypothetical protein ACXACY_22885 [Candidatus Hodarchaeales archaeon]|jgi:hypothetical protein